MARSFTHPDLGHSASVELFGRNVVLTFHASTAEKAESMFESIAAQLKAGNLNLTMMGKATRVEDSRHDS